MAKRYFTVAEASSILPWIEQSLGRVVQLRGQLRVAAQQAHALGEPLSDETLGDEGGAPEVAALRARARGLLGALGDELRALEESGVEVKDLDTGLCDFLARREGRDVYLCWKLGERGVRHWHELAAGFAGRQPLEATAPRLLH